MHDNIVFVICAIIIQDFKVLVAQRSAKMILAEKWELPGGKMEPFENPEQCLKRELNEELNIHVEVGKLFFLNYHEYDFAKIELAAYFADIKSGEIQRLEHQQLRWLSKEELLLMDWAEADIPIIQNLVTSSLL